MLADMAHPPDRALSTAIGDALREARGTGMNTRALADYFGVSDPTISRWENGGHVPALDLLPRFDALVGRPRGELLRRAGYVDDDPADVTAAIRADPVLRDHDKLVLIDVYRSMSSRAHAAARA